MREKHVIDRGWRTVRAVSSQQPGLWSFALALDHGAIDAITGCGEG